jgi:hypothetical protein
MRLYGGKKRVFAKFFKGLVSKGKKTVVAKFAPGGKGEMAVPTSKQVCEPRCFLARSRPAMLSRSEDNNIAKAFIYLG